MEKILQELINQAIEQLANKLIDYFNQQIKKQEEDILDVKAVAQFLKVPESWIYNKVRYGEIPHHKVGHYTRFIKSEILEWLKTGTVKQKKIKKVV